MLSAASPTVIPLRAADEAVDPALSTILVVDDNLDNRESLSRRLARKGFNVAMAEDGEQALAMLAERPFDLVLLDVMMPGLSGLDVLERVRATKSSAELPIVMATAQDQSGDVVRALELGANDYVIKPLDFPVVLARVRTHLRLKHTVQRVLDLERQLSDQNAELMAAAERTEYELQAAARVQAAFLPKAAPDVPGVGFSWTFKPSAQLAGDSLNIVDLGAGRVGFYVLDVSGHGVAASLLAVAATRLLSTTGGAESLLLDYDAARELVPADPARVAERLNERLPWDAQTLQFLTLFYAVYDTASRVLRYTSAGHPAPAIVRHGTGAIWLEGSDLPIGIDTGTYSQREVVLEPGDRVYLYTDGVSESMDPAGELFGRERIYEALAKAQNDPLNQSINTLLDALSVWRKGAAAKDDVAVLGMNVATL